MQANLVAAMLQSRMRPDEGLFTIEIAVLRHIYVCSDVKTSLSRCWWCIIVDNDSIEKNAHVSCNLDL